MKLSPFVFALTCALASSAAGQASGTIALVGRVVEPAGSFDVVYELTFGNTQVDCVTRDPGELCRVPRQASPYGRLTIRAPGYASVTRNFFVPASPVTVRIEIGDVSLARVGVPKVAQVIAARAAGGGYRFEITLNNPADREFLVESVRLLAERFGMPHACCCPPSAVFSIGDRLSVIAGSTGNLVNGEFKELIRGQGFTASASGTIIKDGCTGGERLQLDLPSSFVVPKGYSAVYVDVPATFTITNAGYDMGVNGTPDRTRVGNGDSRRFWQYSFWFKIEGLDGFRIRGNVSTR